MIGVMPESVESVALKVDRETPGDVLDNTTEDTLHVFCCNQFYMLDTNLL